VSIITVTIPDSDQIPSTISDSPDKSSQKYATSLKPIFSANLIAGSWSQYAGIAIIASIIYAHHAALISKNSIRKEVANVSQNQNMKISIIDQ
jgi:hypothetical protein